MRRYYEDIGIATEDLRLKNLGSSPSDSIAQLVERAYSKRKVPGSIPGWSVNFFAD